MIVADAGVVADALVDDHAAGTAARAALLAAGDVEIPDCADAEVLHVLRKLWISKTLTDDRFERAVADLEVAPFTRHPTVPLLRRAGDLRHTITAYDGVYVALAEALGCTLVTIDGRLSRAPGIRCKVDGV